MREGAPKAGLFSNDDDNVALKRRQSCHRWASRSHHLRIAANATVARYRPRNIDDNDFSPTAFDDAKKITARRDWRRTEKTFAFYYIFENKHVGRSSSLHPSNIDRRLGLYIVQSNQTITIGQPPMWLYGEKISSSTPSTSRYYHRDRRFRFCLFNVRSMLTWVQSHKCRLKEPANNISTACEWRSMLCSESGCFVILAVHRLTWSISRQSNRYNNNNLSLVRFIHSRAILHESRIYRIVWILNFH